MKSFKQKGLECSPNKIELDAMEREKTSFATMSRNSSGISITFSGSSSQDGEGQKLSRRGSGKDYSGFGTPNKALGFSPSRIDQEDIGLQLTAVKLKLEERRRKIEEEKRRMEQLMSRQREKVGQEAFLRAVSKGIRKAGGGSREIPDAARDEILEIANKVGAEKGGVAGDKGGPSDAGPRRPFSLKLSEGIAASSVQTPEMEALDITRMSDSLYSLQSDIHRLAQQQTQIQNIMNTAGGGQKCESQGKDPFYISQSPHSNKPFYMHPAENQENQPFSHDQDPERGPQPFFMASSPKSHSTPLRRVWGDPHPVVFPQQQVLPAQPRQEANFTQQPLYQHQSTHLHPGSHPLANQLVANQYSSQPIGNQFTHPPANNHYVNQQANNQFVNQPNTCQYVSQPSTNQYINPPAYPNPMYNQTYSKFDQFGRPVQWAEPGSQQNYPGAQPNHLVNQPVAHPSFGVNQPPYFNPGPGYNPPYTGYSPQPYHCSTYTPPLPPASVYTPPHPSGPTYTSPQPPGPSYTLPHPPESQPSGAFNRSLPPQAASPDLVTTDGELRIRDLNRSAPLPDRFNSPDRREFTQVEDRRKPVTAEKPSLSASFLQQKRRLAESQDSRPRSSNLEQLLRTPGRSRTRDSSHELHRDSSQELRHDSSQELRRVRNYSENENEGAQAETSGGAESVEGEGASPAPTTFLELSSSPRTYNFARISPVPPIEPEMTSSTLETFNQMKTLTIGDTAESQGFVISFDDPTPIKPKPSLKPRKPAASAAAGARQEEKMSPVPAGNTTPLVTPVESSPAHNDELTEGNAADECDFRKVEVGGRNLCGENYRERCGLCESSDISEFSLKLCFRCIKTLKAHMNSPDEELKCVGGDQEDNPQACPALAGCEKCLMDRGRQMGFIQKIRDMFQEAIQENVTVDEKKEEWVHMMTLRRKQQVEEGRAKREEESRRRREEEEVKKEEILRKKEDEKKRREDILEQHRIKKEQEKEDKPSCPPVTAKFATKLRPSRSAGGGKPRPKTIHVDNEQDIVAQSSGLRGSQSNLSMSSITRNRYTGSLRRGSNVSLHDEDIYAGSLKGLGHIGRSKSSSVSNLGPGSLPLGLRHGRGRDFDDGASDISSTTSGYRSGRVSARLFREPVSKSNRPIIMNAVEYVVFPGAVNRDTRMRVLEEIERCDCPHFLLLFRDSRLQFRALYAFYPDTEEVFKIYGTGPKQINDNMMELYYKYNSGGKKFTQIHTRHLTVTIDAFTIHNSLWMGKKAKLPDKKDLPLVI